VPCPVHAFVTSDIQSFNSIARVNLLKFISCVIWTFHFKIIPEDFGVSALRITLNLKGPLFWDIKSCSLMKVNGLFGGILPIASIVTVEK
jgi:hypothetical protein